MRGWTAVVLTALVAACGNDNGQGAGAPHPGEQVYTRFCFSCHAAGVADAPRLGDAEAWAPRIAKGREALIRSTIDGMPPGMPARGLCSSCSDEELAQAVDYMVEQSR